MACGNHNIDLVSLDACVKSIFLFSRFRGHYSVIDQLSIYLVNINAYAKFGQNLNSQVIEWKQNFHNKSRAITLEQIKKKRK